MFSKRLLVTFSAIAMAVPSGAATKCRSISERFVVVRDGVRTESERVSNYGFRAEIIGDVDGLKSERSDGSERWVTAKKGETYSVRLTNPLPVRVAVNLTVDGLNAITGDPTGISDGRKWIIEPNSSITIRGWQVNESEARRFFFTDKPKSYAKWRGRRLNADLAQNCGVIGAAFFWNSDELRAYRNDHPSYVWTRTYDQVASCAKRSMAANEGAGSEGYFGGDRRQAAPAAAPMEEFQKDKAEMKAGTGMGTRESHPTELVDFHFDAGMYTPEEAILIYYDFAKAEKPNPFPSLSFAPEMR